MKSADKDFILETANEYFAKKKWGKALSLYDRLPNLVAGTDDAPNVVYNSAYANYYQKNYRLAGHQFKNFSASYPDDARREEASYMAALCYYEGSLDYNLDQTNTDLAINELQDFINKYPNSERSKNINQLIEELMYKQEFKAYENAKQYFKMGLYKSSDIAFENILEDFPATKLRPKIYDYILKSKYELAVNSKFDLKKEEDEEILSTYRDLGIDVIETSTYSNIGIDELKLQLINKQAIFVGNSGVGKSSLTNSIMGDDEIKTSHVSDKSKRGRHTTTTSKYYVWEDNSSIIDTPGIRSLDVSTFSPIEIQDYFPEFENWRDKCKYSDCLHFNEPYDSCIVKQGVTSGFISPERYESYLRIMSDILGKKYYESILSEVAPDFKKTVDINFEVKLP